MEHRVTTTGVIGSSLSMMLTGSPFSARLARACGRAYRFPMSAWPEAHAGFGVDGAAPDLAPAGDAGPALHESRNAQLDSGTNGAIRSDTCRHGPDGEACRCRPGGGFSG